METTTIKRVGFVLKVKDSMIEEYKHHHRHIWPEMLDALYRHGWHNYSLFMRGDGLLFGYFETTQDLQSALRGMQSEDVNRRWQEMMIPFFEIPPESRPDQMLVELEEIAHLD